MVLCAHDQLTGEDHWDKKITAEPDAAPIVDSVFAFRPEYNDCWECRNWLEADPEVAMRRGICRDSATEGAADADRLHRARYQAAERIYLTEVNP